MPLELAQVVAELIEAIALFREIEGGEDGMMDLPGGPAAELGATVREHLEQANDARFVDLEAGVADGTNRDRSGEPLQKRKVDVDVEPLGLVTGEAVGDCVEGGADGVEMIEPLSQAAGMSRTSRTASGRRF